MAMSILALRAVVRPSLDRRCLFTRASPERNSLVRVFTRRRALLKNCAVFGVLYVSAELSQQTIAQAATHLVQDGSLRDLDLKYDWTSVSHYAVLGTLIFPPVIHVWYKWLDRTFASTAAKVVLKKVLLDQLVFGPPALALFFVSLSIMEGKDDVLAECKEKFAATYLLECCFWLPAQAVNFRYVPASLRIPYLGAAAFVWLNILCLIKSLRHFHIIKSE